MQREGGISTSKAICWSRVTRAVVVVQDHRVFAAHETHGVGSVAPLV
jgi:hypothetical protein